MSTTAAADAEPGKPRKIFVIGGTGAQGIPAIRGLIKGGRYSIRVLTRDPESPSARKLRALSPLLEFITGTFTDEKVVRSSLRGCWGAFVNLDGFNTGEKAELFWGMRVFEIAREERLRMYVWGNLDYVSKEARRAGFAGEDLEAFRCGHYDGKGRVGQWVLWQGRVEKELEAEGLLKGQDRMRTALFTTGPYIEMAIASNTPMSPTVEDGVVTWRLPLGRNGAVAHVALQDVEHYVRWLFDNPDEADGLDLGVAIAHVHYPELAAAFERVTGHPARFADVSMEEYWAEGLLSKAQDRPSAYNSDPSDPAAMTVRQNFTGFWNVWRHSGGNEGVIRRDYELLDEIHPNRIRSVEEWLRAEEERRKTEGEEGIWQAVQNPKPVLKITMDRWRGRL